MSKHTALPLNSDVLGFAEIISPRGIEIESGDEIQQNLFQTEKMRRYLPLGLYV